MFTSGVCFEFEKRKGPNHSNLQNETMQALHTDLAFTFREWSLIKGTAVNPMKQWESEEQTPTPPFALQSYPH